MKTNQKPTLRARQLHAQEFKQLLNDGLSWNQAKKIADFRRDTIIQLESGEITQQEAGDKLKAFGESLVARANAMHAYADAKFGKRDDPKT